MAVTNKEAIKKYEHRGWNFEKHNQLGNWGKIIHTHPLPRYLPEKLSFSKSPFPFPASGSGAPLVPRGGRWSACEHWFLLLGWWRPATRRAHRHSSAPEPGQGNPVTTKHKCLHDTVETDENLWNIYSQGQTFMAFISMMSGCKRLYTANITELFTAAMDWDHHRFPTQYFNVFFAGSSGTGIWIGSGDDTRAGADSLSTTRSSVSSWGITSQFGGFTENLLAALSAWEKVINLY